jgi:hypothetical protein
VAKSVTHENSEPDHIATSIPDIPEPMGPHNRNQEQNVTVVLANKRIDLQRRLFLTLGLLQQPANPISRKASHRDTSYVTIFRSQATYVSLNNVLSCEATI